MMRTTKAAVIKQGEEVWYRALTGLSPDAYEDAMKHLQKVFSTESPEPDPGLFEKLVNEELLKARGAFPTPMNSAHEGFAILAEEVDELWDQVKTKQGDRDRAKMLSELVQVAAMARRMAEDVVLGGRINV